MERREPGAHQLRGQRGDLQRPDAPDDHHPAPDHPAAIDIGKYWIPNNQWGAGTGSGSQCIWTSWQFSVTQNGTVNQNVAYDCWLHPMASPGSADQPTDELMIWLYRSNASPAGSRQGTVTIGGTTWEIWRGYVGTWNVYSYVRTSNTTNANLNIRDFTNDLVARGWMSSSKYLTSVQAGPEIFTGNGQVTTSSYSVTIN
ncbi:MULTISPECIES: hypothetical protein [unclassified Micromonospora]|uniref:GH12 family glycosyl hydrolase domain-containing protein n=1 Tax=unclassified Micromonospora TaxID=2617518 RepID=UPI00364429EC